MNTAKKLFLAFIIFLLPWQAVWLVRPDTSQYARIGLYATDVLMLMAIMWIRPRFVLPKTSLCVFLYFIIASFFTVDPWVAIWKIATIAIIVLFVLAVTQNVERKYARQAIIAAAGFEALLALGQFFSQYIGGSTALGTSAQNASMSGASVVADATSRWLRAYGIFPHPNILGGFLAIALLIVVDEYFHCYENFYAAWRGQEINKKNFWTDQTVRQTAVSLAKIVTTAMIIAFGLLASFSRSAMLAFGVAFVVYVILEYRTHHLRAAWLGAKFATLLLIVVATWSIFLPNLLLARVEAQGSLEMRSVTERLAGYDTAWHVFSRAPLFGTGLGQYTQRVQRFVSEADAPFVQPVHNAFVLIATELGIVGLMVLALLLWPRVKLFFTTIPVQTKNFVLAMTALLFIIAILDHYFWSLHAGMVLVAVAILASVKSSWQIKKQESRA